jgi:hypothetical protein
VGRNLRAWLALVIPLVLLAAGCGKGGPKVGSVSGKVYYRGALLKGGTIAFVPDPEMGGHGEVTGVEIGADGSYTLEAPPGWHRVTVSGPLSALVPARYADPELSKLSRKVEAGAVNVHDIRLD